MSVHSSSENLYVRTQKYNDTLMETDDNSSEDINKHVNMNLSYYKPGTSKASQKHVTCEKMKTRIDELRNEDIRQRADLDVEKYSISSDDSDIIMYDDINTSLITNDETDTVDPSFDSNSAFIIDNLKSLSQIISENVGLKNVLFRNHLMEPISFMLLLHDYGLELKLSKLIEDCGGLVYNSIKDIDGYTAVFVKDESLHWSYVGPVFKLSYIAACIEARKIIDITPFFKNNTLKKQFTKNFNFMSIIYYKKFTWDEVPTKYIISTNHNSSVTESREQKKSNSSSDDDFPLVVNEGTKMVKKKTVNKHTRSMYSFKEEENIVRYIIENKAFAAIKGRALWEKMERKNVCPQRTWQSMKERFKKRIVFNLDSFKFISDKDKELFQRAML